MGWETLFYYNMIFARGLLSPTTCIGSRGMMLPPPFVTVGLLVFRPPFYVQSESYILVSSNQSTSFHMFAVSPTLLLISCLIFKNTFLLTTLSERPDLSSG
ncbi:hypothetical protein GOODEAATRI_013288 [Goodea atripinnis]|uniref:Uncharacterized protein n=1 Tax=Goodea atripinnis TaxID=208336 RepID=A0ABV0MTN6_9TELE